MTAPKIMCKAPKPAARNMLPEGHGEKSATKQRRRKPVGEGPSRPRDERSVGPSCFRISGPAGDADRDERFGNPGQKPGVLRGLSGGDGSRAQSGDAHGEATPPGNCGE